MMMMMVVVTDGFEDSVVKFGFGWFEDLLFLVNHFESKIERV
jgi:hypothetical protein